MKNAYDRRVVVCAVVWSLFFLLGSAQGFMLNGDDPNCNNSCPAGGKVGKSIVVVNIGGSGVLCPDAAASILSTYQSSWASWAAASCVLCTNYDPADCSVIGVVACCSPPVNLTNTEIAVGVTGTVTGVPQTTEEAAAQAFFDAYGVPLNYYDDTDLAAYRTDTLGGYTYQASMGSDGSAENVHVSAWKRAGYTFSNGSPIPLASITGVGGGSGGGGTSSIDPAGVATGVGTALESHGLTQAGIQAAVQSVADGVTGGTVNTAPTSDSTPYNSSTFGSSGKSFGDIMNDFKTGMQSTGLVGLPTSFLAGMPTTGGSPADIVINGGHTFGTHSWNVSSLSGVLIGIKSLVLILSGWSAVKIVTLKGGGG